MSVKFIGYIGFNDNSELHAGVRSRALDRNYVEAAAKAQEEGGFDRVLIPFSSNSPESQIVAAYASAITTKLGFLVAHRPGFTQPTLAARQLATLDQLSGGRVAVHIITGGADGASAGGSKSARIRPLEGEAFLISAMRAHSPAACLALSALAKPRGAGCFRASASTTAAGRCVLAAATSSRL